MSENAEPWRIPGCNNAIKQEPTLKEAKIKGITLITEDLEQMDVNKFYEMSKDNKIRWILNKIGRYQDQINESANTHKIPPQLIAAVILNELIDIDWKDVVQQKIHLGGSIGISQIQIKTAVDHHLVIFPDDEQLIDKLALIAYAKHAANCGPPVGDTPIAVVPMIPPSDKFWRDGAESEIAEERLTIPQYAIEAAAREIALLIKNMTAHRENPWQKKFGFSLEDVNQLKSVNDIYKYILGKNQLEKEKNLAELIAAAYNSPEIVIAVKQESITRDSPEFKYRDAVPHGDNARDAAEALHAPDMSAMDLVEAIEKMGYINTITKNKIKNLLEKLKLEIIVHKSRPGQDNPDDNDNIARGSSPFSFVNRNSYMRAKKKNYSIVDSLFKNANVKNCLGYLIEYEDPFSRGALLDLSANFSSILENEISVESIGEEKSQSFIKAYASILNQWATIPDVAVLGAGDANGALALLANFREPATLVRPAISYDQLRQFCLLIIPTGALSDWHASKKFQKTMQEYTADGGKVLVLAQQFGKEYNALPGTIQAYGWAEDQSCQYASSQITAMIPAFCSMTTEKPDFNVDGYFYGYPPESTVWLTRTMNEQPCMLSYSFGKGKIVMSTLYMDWAAENHQGTVDEGNFFRDLVASLLAPESVPVFSLKEKIRQKIEIVNTSSEEKLQIQPVLIDPRGDEVRLETISASIHPHRAEEFEIDMPLLDKPGYYQIAANVQTESGEALDDIYYGYRFVISSLPRLSDREKKDLSFSVQSDLENYVRGSTGKFTILVWNNSDMSRKIKVDYRFPQNSWASQNPQDYQGSQILEIPAGLDAKLDLSIKIVNKNGNDWLRAAFFDSLSGEKLGEASKGFFTKEPETRIELKTDRDSYEIGDRLRALVSFDNPFANEQHCDLVFQITDSSGNSVCRLEFEEKVNAGINDFSFEFELPKEMISGRPILQVFIQMDGEMIGIGEATFDYVGPKLSYSGSISDRFSKAPISNARISFYFGNQLFKAVAGQDGKFELQLPSAAYKVEASAEGYNLATADAIIYPRDNEPFTLLLVPVGQAINAGMVYGTTYDRTSNQRVPNLSLIFSKGEDVIEIKSDRRGDYSLSLESGDYRVRALKDGHTASNQFILRVVQGYKQQFDIYAAIGKFRLTAKDIITDEILTDLRVETFRLDQPLPRNDVSWEVNQGRVIQIGEGGRLALQVTKEGYLPLDTEIFASEIASDFVIYLTRIKHPFSITMADCLSDKAIDRVLLTIKKPDGTVVQTLETDLLGNCSGSLEAGRWLIEFEREGYHKIAAEFYHSARNSTLQTYYLKRISYPYQLQVLDVRDEKPVPGVAIRICRPDGQDCREGQTDPNGFFSLDLPEARWLVNLKKGLYSEQKTEIFHSIQGIGPDPFYLYPDPQAAQGKLKIQCLDYLSEQPLADSKVTVKSLTTGFELSDKTDRDGKVAVAIPDGRVEVSLEREGYAAHKTEILFAHQIAAEQRFYLVPDCSNYRLEVRNILSNQAIENVSVILVSGDQKMALGKTDKDGRIILNIPRGRRRLAFELEGYETLDTEFFNSGTSKALEQDIETVYLTRTREKYAGQVRDSSGKGIESVSLVFQQDSDVQSVTSDSEGRFIALLKYGKYEAILSRSGYREQKTQVFFGRHESILQTFYMYRMEEAIPADPGRLDLRVYDALTGRPLLKFSAYSGGWTEGQNGQVEFQRNFGNQECAVRAEGYLETGSFFPTAYPGKKVEREIFLWPVTGQFTLRAFDALTGKPIPSFSAYSGGWKESRDGQVEFQRNFGNWECAVKADGYLETGSFFPTAYPGKKVEREIYLWPVAGQLNLRVFDALTGKTIPSFSAYSGGWTEGQNGQVEFQRNFGNRECAVRAEGYHDTGSFFPTAYPGKKVEREIFLWPVTGQLNLRVCDALTGKLIPSFSAYSGGWKESRDGQVEFQRNFGNRECAVRAEGYHDTGSFFPTAYPGKKVEREIFLWPVAGQLSLMVFDALTGKPIPEFSAYSGGWTEGRDGQVEFQRNFGNQECAVRAEGYQDTGSFFPTAYPGKKAEREIFLWPVAGQLRLRVFDALTGKPIPSFSAYSGGWTKGQNGRVEFQRNFGNRECAVKAEGYHDTGSFFPTAFPGKGTEQSIFLFQSEPESILRLNVEDLCTGEPLGKARIQIDNGPVLSANARGIFTYQGKGHFKVIWIRAGLPGYNEKTLPYYIINGRKSLQFTIPLEEKVENGIGGLIVETLSHDDQKPIQDAAVFLYAEDTEFAAKTDHLGQAVFKDLRAGIYSISVQKTGFVIHEGKAKVQGEQLNKTILKMYPLRTQKILSPFNPRLISIPDELSIAPGEKKELAVCIQNFGEVSGKAKVLLDIPGFSRDNKILVLGPGEIKETAFEIDLPNDAISASFPFRVQVNGNSIKGLINVLARQFHVQAWMEDQTYSEGSLAALNLEISLEGHTSSMPLQLRVNWNDFSTTRDFVLEGGRAALKVDDIPVRFTGNKLLYGLYYPTGRSIYLNAIYIHRGGKTQAVPDKQQYRAGDRVKLQITGDPNEILMLSCPLWKGAAEIKLSLEGRAEYEFALPGRMLTGSYQIDVPDKIAIPIDVRGMEMTIKGKKIEILPESEKAHISWNALTNQPMDCAWRLERRLLMESIEIASGSLTVNEGLEEQRIAVPLAQIEDASHLSLNISAKTEQDWENVAVLDFNLD